MAPAAQKKSVESTGKKKKSSRTDDDGKVEAVKAAKTVEGDVKVSEKVKKKATPKERILLERSSAPRQFSETNIRSPNTFKAISWNVAGLRSFFNQKSEEENAKLVKLKKLWLNEAPDVLFLSEHKLQEQHCDEIEGKLREALSTGDDNQDKISFYWNCSTVKKGYSGVVCIIRGKVMKDDDGSKETDKPIVKQKQKQQKSISSFFPTDAKEGQSKSKSSTVTSTTDKNLLDTPKVNKSSFCPRDVRFGITASSAPSSKDKEVKDYNTEGRVITVEYDNLFIVSAYVPNSGEGLKRLDYRLNVWETDMNNYLSSLDREKPVIYLGDLNVAHLDQDIWNVDAKHIPTSAGTTPQERSAFGKLIASAAESDRPEDDNCKAAKKEVESHSPDIIGINGFVDSFRHFHKDSIHWFSYWSVRANNFIVNRGLRLDYALISRRCAEEGTSSRCDIRLVDGFLLPEVVIDHCPVGITVAKK